MRLLSEMIGSNLTDPPHTLERIDPDAFEDFYAAKWREVYRTLAVVLSDPDLAHEATDEAMVRAYQRWDIVRRYANPAGWVYRVGLNWARSRLRKTRRVSLGVPDRPAPSDVPKDPELERALAQLPMPQREVVVLHYLFDQTTPQIALTLDLAEGTVKSRLHRALNRLRKELPDDS